MSQKFVKGRTTNHLTFPLVDSTDFATPESALSAAAKLKVYGKLRANDTVHLVSSGTGSLTNDLKHVGASALGLYTIGLVKADLSDASAAWYDQYIISISATGAAYQTIIVDGGIDDSALSAYQSRLSDLMSYLVAMSGMLSDTHSAAILAASNASEAQSAAVIAASRALVIQSIVSDIDSDLRSDVKSLLTLILSDTSQIDSLLSSLNSEFLSRVPKAVATNSQLSDLHSDLRSYLVLMSDSISNIDSAINSQYSDLASKVGATNPTASDIASVVWTNTPGAAAASRILRILSDTSQINSVLSDFQSDFQSRVPKLVATNSQLSDLASDIKSAATAANPTASDIASVVWTNTPGAAAASRILRILSDTSQINSVLSDLDSNFQSRVPKAVATNSQLSDLHSDLKSYLGVMSGVQSDIYSLVSNINSATLVAADVSDFASAVAVELSNLFSDVKSAVLAGGGGATASDIASHVWLTHATGVAVASRVLQIRNQVSDLQSDFQSRVPKAVATNSQLSDLHSDLRSFLVVDSSVRSNIYSLLSDFQSDFQSRVPKEVASKSLLSDVHSDLKSALADVSVTLTAADISNIASEVASAVIAAGGAGLTASDVASHVWLTHATGVAVASRVLQVRNQVSDLQSDFQSRVPKLVATNSQLSDLASDLKSAVAVGGGATASDIASHLWTTNTTGAAVASRVLRILSDTSQINSVLSDFESNFQSRVPKRVATDSQLSDLHSDLKSHLAVSSDVQSSIYSLLSDLHSDVGVMSDVVSSIYSLASDLHSDVGVISGVVSDIRSGVNVTQINGTTLTGDGGATPWGPA